MNRSKARASGPRRKPLAFAGAGDRLLPREKELGTHLTTEEYTEPQCEASSVRLIQVSLPTRTIAADRLSAATPGTYSWRTFLTRGVRGVIRKRG